MAAFVVGARDSKAHRNRCAHKQLQTAAIHFIKLPQVTTAHDYPDQEYEPDYPRVPNSKDKDSEFPPVPPLQNKGFVNSGPNTPPQTHKINQPIAA
jgi:hypothetical protein